MNRTAIVVGLGVAMSWAGLITFAGPITPPVGPVAPTAKPLAEIEPRTAINLTNTPGDADSLFKIVNPGSYYLTGNVIGVAGKHGIEIAASGVWIDLNGFDLAGVPGMGAFDGVSVTASSVSNITVVNGSVRTWGGDGVDLGTLFAATCRVERVLARNNAGNGISADEGAVITDCTAYLNGGTGIGVGSGAIVTHCAANYNSGKGISTNNGCIVADCTLRGNSLDGILCAGQCEIRGNACSFNGISTGDGAGIHVTQSDNRIEGNNCAAADRGIEVGIAGNIIIRNTCSGNTTNWVIAINNVYGPIIDRTAPGSGAVSGNSAVSTLGSTDPNANFSY